MRRVARYRRYAVVVVVVLARAWTTRGHEDARHDVADCQLATRDMSRGVATARALAACGRRARVATSSCSSRASRASRASARATSTSRLEFDDRRRVVSPAVWTRGGRSAAATTTTTTRVNSSSSASSSSSYDALATTLGEDRRELLEKFARILIAANKGEYGTLTGATSAREALEDHVSDALALLPTFDALLGTGAEASDAARRVCDVGSGAGLPGVPLAIARPEWRFTLLDSLKKRTTFLERTVAELGLTNVDVVWARAEDFGRDDARRESYDVVTARAVAELRVLAEFCVPLVRVGGHWVSAKNADVEAEAEDATRAVETLGGGAPLVRVVDAFAPDGSARTAVIYEKLKPTPDKYPRRAGMAKKRPL